LSFHLTPQTMEAAYELLRTTPPFKGWKLPPGDTLRFEVIAHPRWFGRCFYWYDDKKPKDGVYGFEGSYRCIRQLSTLIAFMSHEMCHLKEFLDGSRGDVEHGASFKALAKRVCKVHGFDEGAF